MFICLIFLQIFIYPKRIKFHGSGYCYFQAMQSVEFEYVCHVMGSRCVFIYFRCLIAYEYACLFKFNACISAQQFIINYSVHICSVQTFNLNSWVDLCCVYSKYCKSFSLHVTKNKYVCSKEKLIFLVCFIIVHYSINPLLPFQQKVH